MHKTKQQSFALRLALDILRKNGYPRPKKRQVLNFIRMRNLLKFPEEELQKRWREDHDAVWENDIAWKRKNLFEDGEVLSPERGVWELSAVGVEKIEKAKHKWLKFDSPEERKRHLTALDYFTEDLYSWMLKIARGESLSLKLESKNEIVS